ncbi:unnamed protein product [Leptosia nina]|uniref:N-acetyltransferase domain-containing protein n=1 Tax=Leptosia nina TaxID=320188 RepID=A0AAV1IW09_9NEOP
MPFKRNWDASCPRVWEKWEANGQEWVIQDLDPKDDDLAIEILLKHLCTDEVLCSLSKLEEDEESLIGMKKFWIPCLKQRMSLALYTWIDGQKTLVALNVCVVMTAGDTFPDVEIEGEKWKNVFSALEYVEIKRDPHKYLELNTLLHAFGLVVKKEYRGQRLGAKLLAAREPLCRLHGIKGTTTVFTGPASQKLAASCGFTSICEASWKDLADSGLDYPSETNKFIKLMMTFERNWDESCPRVWERWVAKGQDWVVQDLDPNDDEAALDIFLEHFCSDELLCSLNKLNEDEVSRNSIRNFWGLCLMQRMSLAVYTWVDGKKTLVALNVCVVRSTGDKADIKIEGKKLEIFFKSMKYVQHKCDAHEYLGLETVLHAYGLVVKREYRGQRLGEKLLNAREPLSKLHGIKGTATVFNGPVSQKLASNCGFETICEVSLKELSDSGQDYPPDPDTYLKLMVKRYD